MFGHAAGGLLGMGGSMLGDARSTVTALKKSPGDAKNQQRHLKLLTLITCDLSESIRAGNLGAVEVVLAALTAHKGDAGVLIDASNCLGSLVCDSSNRAKAIAAGAVEIITDAARGHGSNPELLASCFNALTNLARDASACAKLGATGVIQLLVAAVHRHPLHSEMVTRCVHALGFLAGTNSANCLRMAPAGAPEAIILGLCSHPCDAGLQSRGIHALALLCEDSRAAERAVSAGGTQVVLAALRGHPADRDVQARAANCLGWLATVVPAGPRSIGAAGVSALLAARRVFSADVDVCYRCFFGLAITLRDEQVAQEADAAAVVGGVVASLEAHPFAPDLQQWGCEVVGSLQTSTRRALQTAASACGVTAALAGVLRRAPSLGAHGIPATTIACRALAELLLIPGERPKAASLEIVASVLTTLRRAQPGESELLDAGFVAIMAAAVNPEEQRRSAESVAQLTALVKSLKSRGASAEVVTTGELALGTLVGAPSQGGVRADQGSRSGGKTGRTAGGRAPSAAAVAAAGGSGGPSGGSRSVQSEPVKACHHCGKIGAPRGESTPMAGAGEQGAVRLLLCSGCKQVRFCSTECQTAAWPAHKAECKKAQAGGGGGT